MTNDAREEMIVDRCNCDTKIEASSKNRKLTHTVFF